MIGFQRRISAIARGLRLQAVLLGLFAFGFVACGEDSAPDRPPPSSGAAGVTVNRLEEAAPGDWLSHGRDPGEQRFSPLTQIDAENASKLGLAWKFPTGLKRGHEATPIVVDGVMYLTGSWSVVFALDAATGELLWRWDPEVSEEVGRKACCDVVNRGVAVYDGKVYVGVLDGRLVALDAVTGVPVWQTVTVDQTLPYTVTGAPRVADGRIIIGNGGAEFGVRGYVSAYDPTDGQLLWRTYTVPGDPSEPFESEALERAAETWKGGKWWEIGGGGTVWDSIAYDPDLDLLYVGTGNGSPWTRYHRSPGGGDNLYLSSILALDPETGELVWHYQTTPGDNWDFTATQHMILADLEIDGRTRQVIMQAPKNGFFYVLDRKTGEFISAESYVEVTWADGVDPTTGRPIENGTGDYGDGLALVKPMAFGGHNWNPMSFNPMTGLVYIPAQEIMGIYLRDEAYKPKPQGFNTGTDNAPFTVLNRELVDGHLLAWDPVAQKEAWRHPHGIAGNGGTLTTAGNLVFQGTADGRFLALRADDGQLLWQSHSADNGIIAAPISYEVGGVQFVTVVAGWGGAYSLVAGDGAAAASNTSDGVVLTYALSNLEFTPELVQSILASRDPDEARPQDLYHVWCARCHGANAISGGATPDLRTSVQGLGDSAFQAIVHNGLPETGMPGFGQWLNADQIEELYEYVRAQPQK